MWKYYIPWFGNIKDPIWEKKYSDYQILSANIRQVDLEKIREFIKNKKDQLVQILQSKYKDTDWETVKIVLDKQNFSWFLRDIPITVKLLYNQIKDSKEKISLVWHSQWGFLVISLTLNYPDIVNKIESIHLLAPVISFEDVYWFHKNYNSWYLHPKWVIVREQFINSAKNNNQNDLLLNMLNLLKNKWFTWKIILSFALDDNVVCVEKYNINMYKRIWPDIKIQILDRWWHYLWYK